MPQAATVPLGGTQNFRATVTGSSDTTVIWQVNGVSGGAPATGTVDASGNFTAPRAMPPGLAVVVRAVSHADPTAAANANVTITSDVSVSILPAMPSVELGATQTFMAQVTGSGNPLTTVTWSVGGANCAGAACGTITAAGAYTAPQVLPSPANVTITATSGADPSKMKNVITPITSNFMLAVSGPAGVNPAAMAQFNALLTPVPGSNPSTAMNWSVSGAGCSGANNQCGTILSAGVFIAPSVAPQPNSITITATSVADPSKSASTTTQVNTQMGITVMPGNATVMLEHQQQFTATVTGLANPAVQWYVNNLLAGDPNTVGTISNTGVGGLYTAPVNMVAGMHVTVMAKSVSNSSVLGSATVMLSDNITVQVTPTTASRVVGTRQTFTAAVANTSNSNVEWEVDGTPNGNATVGVICVVGSTPCQPPALSVAPGSVDYLAPIIVPSPAVVTVTALSVADRMQSGSAGLTVVSQSTVTISPPSATVPPGGTQVFLATVVGSSDQNVSWDVNGFPNGALNLGVICLPGSNPCQAPAGPMAGPIEFRAPATPPSPNNTLTVTATSELGAAIAQSAVVTVINKPLIVSLLPASVLTSVTQPFNLRVQGMQFIAGSAGSGSTVILAGSSRVTTCPSAIECDITIDPVDVASPGMIAVTVQNPGTPPAASNAVDIMVVPPDNTEDIISLDTSNPLAMGKDIIVVEPTTAGALPPVTLTLQELGMFDSATSNCSVGSSVVRVSRPASGSTSLTLCLVGTNLGAVNAVTFSGPPAGDLIAGNLIGGPGTITLAFTLTVPASALPGVRTVFANAVNSDKAALTGSLEVQ